MAKTVVSFVLDEEQDRDLLRWLKSLPKGERSKAIREGLRAHVMHSDITLGDLYAAIMDLKRQGLTLAAGSDDSLTSDEPPDAAAALDSLGL